MPIMGLTSARPSRSRFVLTTLAAATIAGVGILTYYLINDEPAVQQPETVEVERGTVPLTASSAGMVTPSQQWPLGIETDAETTEVAAGDKVAKGDALASREERR